MSCLTHPFSGVLFFSRALLYLGDIDCNQEQFFEGNCHLKDGFFSSLELFYTKLDTMGLCDVLILIGEVFKQTYDLL